MAVPSGTVVVEAPPMGLKVGNMSMAASDIDYLTRLWKEGSKIAEQGKKPSIETAPATLFICSNCKAIASFDGNVAEPLGNCPACMGEFLKSASGYAIYSVMKPIQRKK